MAGEYPVSPARVEAATAPGSRRVPCAVGACDPVVVGGHHSVECHSPDRQSPDCHIADSATPIRELATFWP